MNKLLASTIALSLLVGSAQAADLGIITQDAPAGYIASDWTGFYAGIFGGVGAGSNDFTGSLGGVPVLGFSGNSAGGLGGVQVGADYQMGNFVIGAVADIALTNITSNDQTQLGGGTIGFESTLNYLGTLRARIGFVPADNLLAYVHGGLAYGQTDAHITLPPPAPAGGLDFESANRVGYTIGAGVEYKVTQNISLQTEYAYTNLGSESVTPAGGPLAGVDFKDDTAFHTVKAGVNFRF